MGVDPGLTRCGLGVVDALPGRRVRLVGVGVATSSPGLDVDQRLLVIERLVEEWLEEHAPDAVAVERVFAQHNLRTVMGTAQVAGIAMVAAARRRIPVALHTPSEVKAAVTGNGRADKAQVQTMVARLLQLDELPRPADAADALALAICHLWRPAGALGAPQRPASSMTAAQRAWAAAEQAARR
jgi:crossover junction endodeoxyribonuclease RuvC